MTNIEIFNVMQANIEESLLIDLLGGGLDIPFTLSNPLKTLSITKLTEKYEYLKMMIRCNVAQCFGESSHDI